MVTESALPRGPDHSVLRPVRGEVLAALARVLDFDPEEPMPHHGRVAVLAARVAGALQRVAPRLVFYAGLVHDIGIPSADQEPPFRWSLEQQANEPILRSHPLVGAQVVAAVPELVPVAQIVLDHHEWVNGHGYPRGKGGREIAAGAQAVRLADTCDMLLREQTQPELLAFLDALRSSAQPQVDLNVIDAATEVLGDGNLYAQLLLPEDVGLLVQATIRHVAPSDFAATDDEVTRLLELFAHVSDARSSDRVGHSRRLADLAVLVAMALGLSEAETTRLKWAALVHDVGLVGVSPDLLNRPALLSPEELDGVRRHTALTEQIVGAVSGLEEVAGIAASHGECFDGSGRPHGLQGPDIPIGGRILAVCDTFDALTTRRPYREARDTSLAVDILVKGSGSVFDPDIVQAAVPVFLISQAADRPVPAGA